GYGTGVQKGLEAAELLAEGGIEVTVADARFAKPLDTGLLAQLAAEHELPDRYVTHGKPALQHAEVGYTGKAIAARIEAAIGASSGALAGASAVAALHPQLAALLAPAP